MTIAACVVCRNESAKLAKCLDSVQWADEILVMDLSSSDDSAEVARAHGARVIVREPVPIVERVRNDLAAAASSEWILVLDPDENISPALADRLREVEAAGDVDGVVIPRMNVDFGHAPLHPNQRYEPQLRMYRRDRVEWPTLPNTLPSVPEDRLRRLPNDDALVILHERNITIAETVERVVRYAPAEAEAMLAAGRPFSAQEMLTDLRRRADRYFLQNRAFDEGVPGVARAGVLLAYHFYVWVAFWQLSGARRTPKDDATIARLGRLVRTGSAAMRGLRVSKRIARRRRP